MKSLFPSSGLLGFVLLVWPWGPIVCDVGAETYLVTKTTDDNGACTVDDCALREAVIAANANPGMDVIEVPAGTYVLTLVGELDESFSMTGDLDIRDDLELRGESAATVTIVGTGTDRVIESFGLSSDDDLTVLISDITVTGGRTMSSGGGIRLGCCTNTIARTTIRDNMAIQSHGGGIFLAGANLTLVDSAVVDNKADGWGGGMRTFSLSFSSDELIAINSTFSGNVGRDGGGITLDSTNASLIHTSIVNNSFTGVGSDASGILARTRAQVTIANSLVTGGCRFPLPFPPLSNGGNIETPRATCMFIHPTDRMNVPDPRVAPLAFNGGTTMSHALLPSSPAIDTAVAAHCEATDQRGVARPQDGDGDGTAGCDVGAYEATPFPVIAVPVFDGWGLVILAGVLSLAGLAAIWRRSEKGCWRV